MSSLNPFSTLADDPAYRSKHVSQYAKRPEDDQGGVTSFSSSAIPGYGYMSMDVGQPFQEIGVDQLSDPTIAKQVADLAHSQGGIWSTLGGQIPEGVGLGPNETGSLMTGIGTSFSVAPEVGGEEELAKKLGGMWNPIPTNK